MLFFVCLFRVGVSFAFLALWVAALAGVVRWGWGRAMSREGDGPVASPLPWVPAKAGTTMGVGGPARAAGVGGGGSRSARERAMGGPPLRWRVRCERICEFGAGG